MGSSLRSGVFSPDGLLVLTASDDSTVKIWSAETGECLRTLKGDSNFVCSAVFSPDSAFVLTACDDCKEAKIWDAESGECLRSLHGHVRSVRSAVFSPDGAFA